MNIKLIHRVLFYLVLSFFPFCGKAQMKGDSNVVIVNGLDRYEYLNQNGQIVLQNNSSLTYECFNRPELIQVAKFYDDFSEIKKANVKGVKAGKPVYEMYRHQNVFFSDVRVCYFNIPFNKRKEKAIISFEKYYYDISLFTQVYFSKKQFIENETVQIIIPAWLDVDIVERNFGEYVVATREESGNQTVIHTFHIRNLPGITDELSMPGSEYILPHILIIPKKASFADREQLYFGTDDLVYQWCKEMIDRCVNNMEMVESFARELIIGCQTEEEQIQKLYGWVQSQIRYIAFEYGLSGLIPESAQEVLHKKYGDCKGMSNLLKVMLSTLGFDARLGWIGTSELLQDESVALPRFDHMICVLYWQGTVHFLDPTGQYMALGKYNENIQNRRVMVEAGDNYKWEQIPAVLPSQNRDSLYYEYVLDGESLSGKAKRILTGEARQHFLAYYLVLPASQRNEMLNDLIKDKRTQDMISDVIITDAESYGDTLTIEYQEQRKTGLWFSGKEAYLTLDTNEDLSDLKIDQSKRINDFLLPYKKKSTRDVVFLLPDEYEVKLLPKLFIKERANYTIYISYTFEEGRVRYRKEITIVDPLLKKSGFTQWNEDLTELNRYYNEQIVLTKK